LESDTLNDNPDNTEDESELVPNHIPATTLEKKRFPQKVFLEVLGTGGLVCWRWISLISHLLSCNFLFVALRVCQ